MVHAVIIGGVLTVTLFKATRFGQVVKKVKTAVTWTEVRVRRDKMQQARHERDLGINRSEDAFHLAVHGTYEPLFPASLRKENLPDRFEEVFKVEATGEFLFKISEWNELCDWVEQKTRRQNGEEAKAEGRDGRWLLHIGRERWKDRDLRAKAFESSKKFSDVWRQTGMWEEQDS
jgi:hypothetical protein